MKQIKQNKTLMVKGEEHKPAWILLDATGKTLGRLASEVTKILRGKHRPNFTPNVDCGDGVIIVNAEKIHVTGSKEAQKTYDYYTGSMSGRREIPFRTMRARDPGFIIAHAVLGMMPKTRLARAQMKRLRVRAGSEHELDAQKPITATI